MVVLYCAYDMVCGCAGVCLSGFVPIELPFFRVDKDVLALDVYVCFVGCRLEFVEFFIARSSQLG